MNISSIVRYHIWDNKRPLMIFYIVIITVVLLLSALSISVGSNSSISGLEIASVIFIFVAGLNSFKDTFHFSLVNGVSRKKQFIGHLVSLLPIAFIMATMDTLLRLIAPFFISYTPLHMSLYARGYSDMTGGVATTLVQLFDGFIWMVFLYMMVAMIGYFITIVYYRSNKLLKLIVSITPPIFLTFGLPVINRMTDGRAVQWLGRAIVKSMGLYNGVNPYIAIVTFICWFAVFSLGSYLLMKKAIIKQ